MTDRRTLIQLAVAAVAELALSAADTPPATTPRKPLFEQALPNVELKGWDVTATEVRYTPGQQSHSHQHPGFVLGYVLEGEVRFQLRGEAERVVHVGEMFYEPPGAVHQTSGNASQTNPARMLALVFHPKGLDLTKPA